MSERIPDTAFWSGCSCRLEFENTEYGLKITDFSPFFKENRNVNINIGNILRLYNE
jgi:hypothetical protein